MSGHTRLPFVFARVLVLALALSAATVTARAQSALSFGPLFQDHAVLQRDRPIPIRGTSGPGDEVTVSIGATTTSARTDAAGRWNATLPAMSAGGPYSLEIRTRAGATRTLSDVLVGDVFLCSGQSNMQLAVAQSRDGDFVLVRSANDRIRLLAVAHAAAPRPAAAFEKAPEWQSAGPESLRGFSAVCYYFGRDVHETERVPVGLVNAAWGGSAIEPWIGEAGLRAAGGFDARLDMLRVFARDEDGANRKYERMWEDWWRQSAASRTPLDPIPTPVSLQNRVVSDRRTARGDPGRMLKLL